MNICKEKTINTATSLCLSNSTPCTLTSRVCVRCFFSLWCSLSHALCPMYFCLYIYIYIIHIYNNMRKVAGCAIKVRNEKKVAPPNFASFSTSLCTALSFEHTLFPLHTLPLQYACECVCAYVSINVREMIVEHIRANALYVREEKKKKTSGNKIDNTPQSHQSAYVCACMLVGLASCRHHRHRFNIQWTQWIEIVTRDLVYDHTVLFAAAASSAKEIEISWGRMI